MTTGILTTNFSLSYISDIDECSSNSNVCHVQASCTNTIGSFKCACDYGYAGDGRTFCLRKLSSLFLRKWTRPKAHGQCNGGVVASWLAVLVRYRLGALWCALGQETLLKVPSSTQVYEWVPANLMLEIILWGTSIPLSKNPRSHFMLQKPEISAGLHDGPLGSHADAHSMQLITS